MIDDWCGYRRRTTRPSLNLPHSNNRSQLTISPIEMNIRKAPDPSPQLELKGFGLELIVPIDDDTLCHALALYLGFYLPVYA